LRMTEQKTLSIEERMEEIRIVNRAKFMLISELKMSEPEAHHYIEKYALTCRFSFFKNQRCLH
ncbi:MAG: ANTAR domain-containing protein, partial [Eggerthellaceae bacterium]|nr:ANTAR domain-containing protein [Eggerthellaceae bacterium]